VTTITSKVCVIGDFAVGKTSVVERFVNNQFSDKYLTTVGVKVDTKEIDLPRAGVRQKLILWDVAGTDTFGDKEFAYLRGAAAYVYVADGTRAQTLGTACKLRERVVERYGSGPSVLLINKHDLTSAWEADEQRIAKLAPDFGAVFETSAKTGDEVETALTRVAELIVERTIEDSR